MSRTLKRHPRRLRARHPVPPLSGPADRRAPRLAAGRRLWRRRDLSRLGRARAGAADPAHLLSGRGRLGRDQARSGARSSTATTIPSTPRDRQLRRLGGAGREGQLPPLHAQGDLRAADRRRPDARAPISARSSRQVALPDIGLRPRRRAARHHRRLRHQLLCRHGRQILVRAVRARAGRARCRLRVPLPRAGPGEGRARALHLASRARRPTRSRRCATPARKGRRSRSSSTCRPARWRARPTCCSRPMPGRRSASPRPRPSPASSPCSPRFAAKLARDKGRMSEEEEREIVDHLEEAPAAMNAALAHDEQIAAMAGVIARRARRALSRARPGLSAGAGRRAEAQGNQLHPRRRLCRRRDEARADRADRRACAGDRAGALRASVREDRLQHAGGAGARRPRRPDLRRRRPRAGGRTTASPPRSRCPRSTR